MALTKCRECGGQVSDDAKTCPHCGSTSPTFNSMGCKIGCFGLCFLVYLFFHFLPVGEHSTPNPQPEAPKHALPNLRPEVTLSGQSLIIKNLNPRPWTDVTIEVTMEDVMDGFKKHLDLISPGDITIAASDFTKSDGTRLNLRSTKPQKVFIKAVFDGEKLYWGGKLD